jgi:argininosuccinate lyase
LFKKNQQIEVNQGLLKSLQGEVSFMKQEIRTLQEQHKKSAQLLNDAGEMYRKLHELLGQLNQTFENRLSQMDPSEVKRKLEILSQEVQKSRTDVTECLTTNKELREAVEMLQRAGLFRKIFS